jgi:uncharacterized membrane protein
MAFCAKCGAQVGSQGFCGTCGAPIGSAAPPPAPGAAPVGPPLASNIGGLLTYIPFVGWIIAIVFLVIEPYKSDRFVRFHAFQSIFLAVFSFVLYWVLSAFVFSTFLGFGFGLLWVLWGLVRLAIFLCWLFMMYKAYSGERYELPFIGQIAAKQAAS